jgi:hypothetical protein
MTALQESPGSKIWTVVTWVGALILWLAIVGWYSDSSPYALGQAAGRFLIYGAVSTVILRWSPKTRQFVQLGALLLGGLFLIKEHRDQEKERARVVAASDLSRAVAAMNVLTGGNSSQQTSADEPAPEDGKGKIAWFLRRYSEGYASAQHRMAVEEGADTEVMPREWPHAKYIADAAAYPSVETYFLGYLRYVDKAREHYPVLMDSIATRTMLEGQLGSKDSADVMEGLSNALASRSQANAAMFDSAAAYGQAALRLHYFLTSLGSRVSYDSSANRARFSVDAERQRASELLVDLQNSAPKVQAVSR